MDFGVHVAVGLIVGLERRDVLKGLRRQVARRALPKLPEIEE